MTDSNDQTFYPRLILDDDDLKVIRAWFRETYGHRPVSRIEMITAFAWIMVTEGVIREGNHLDL